MPTNSPIATDSAAELHKLIGDDATATFESDPTFLESNPAGSASSENLEEQRPGAGQEFQSKSADAEDDEDDVEDGEDDDDLEDEEEDEDADDVDDGLDEDDEDDEVEDDDEEDEDEYEDDEDEDEEDDADEVAASASSSSETLRADGLLGYEDEADDAKKGVDRVTGDVERTREEARKLTDDPDENPYDAYTDIRPTAVHDAEVDSNVVIRPVKPTDLGLSTYAA